MSVPARVDETGGGMDQEAKTAEGALALEPRDEVVRKLHALERGAEHELTGVEDERRFVVDLDELRQLFLLGFDVDERVAGVAEDPEIAVDAHIDAGRLHQRIVVRLDLDLPLAEQASDRPVGEDHARDSMASLAAGGFPHGPSCEEEFRHSVPAPVSMLFEQMEPNERFRARREDARRRRRRRRAILVGLLLGMTASLAAGARFVIGDDPATNAVAAEREPAAVKPKAKPKAVLPTPRALPTEVRGIHVTMALASLDGKIAEYLKLVDEGLNTIELDVKDENGEIGFLPSSVPLARTVGAAKPYYKPREAARLAHRKGVYLIGRVVTFEDPLLAAGRPELAIKNPDGSIWRNDAGLGWTNPYDKRVWDYNVSIAEVAARAGFDEIQFDYVRFPTDGDVDSIVFPARRRRRPAG